LEVCGNGEDDDSDGLTDCDDSDCFVHSGCQEEPPSGGCEDMSLLIRFDVDAVNQVDESGSGNDGTVVGATYVSGRFGGGYEFDGVDDYVALPSINLSGSFSISAWVRADSDFPSEQVIFGAHSGIDVQESLHLRLYDSGKLKFDYYADGVSTDDGVIDYDGWQNVVVSYDAGLDVSKIYVDGEEVVSGDQGPFVGVDPVVSIGNWMHDGSAIQFFNGRIDEVGVWDRALSLSEVEGLSSGVISCECVVVGLGDVGLKIEEWKAGLVSVDAVLDVVGDWKAGC